MEIEFRFLFLFSKVGKGNTDFSFSSRNWRNRFQISLSLLDFTFLPLVNHCLDPSARLAHKGDIMLTSSFDSISDAASHSPNSSNVVKSQNHSFDFLCSDRHGQLVVDRCGPLLNLFKLYQESTVTKILFCDVQHYDFPQHCRWESLYQESTATAT